MKIKEFFKQNTKDGKQAALKYSDEVVILWIVKHEKGLTVVDCITSIRERGYRDDSRRKIENVYEEWLKIWKKL